MNVIYCLQYANTLVEGISKSQTPFRLISALQLIRICLITLHLVYVVQ